MARYIDADALLAELQEEIDFETSMYTEEQNKYFKMGLKCAFRDVKNQPTADVAPRAEVANKICCEIEEEIVAALESNYRARGEQMAKDDLPYELIACINGKINALRGIEAFVEELKNKYAEGRNE